MALSVSSTASNGDWSSGRAVHDDRHVVGEWSWKRLFEERGGAAGFRRLVATARSASTCWTWHARGPNSNARAAHATMTTHACE